MGVGFPLDFSSTSQNILIDKPLKYRLDKQTVRFIENWLNCWDQKVVITNVNSSWNLVNSCLPQGSTLGPIHLN